MRYPLLGLSSLHSSFQHQLAVNGQNLAPTILTSGKQVTSTHSKWAYPGPRASQGEAKEKIISVQSVHQIPAVKLKLSNFID
jgi:hypothetical protein